MRVSSSNLDYVQSFLSFFWFTKDNSITITDSLITIPEINEAVMSNIKLVSYTCAGATINTTFTIEEVKYTMDIYERFGNILIALGKNIQSLRGEIEIEKNEDGAFLHATENKIGVINYESYNCVDRALHFLSIARKERHPAFRISFYVPILESLFTTDKYAVTHKVCERVALYLEEGKDERKELYNFIDTAYNTRSTFLHGQKFSKDDLNRISEENEAKRLDEIIRACLLMVMLCDYEIFTGLKPKGNSTKKTIEIRGDYLKYLMFS